MKIRSRILFAIAMLSTSVAATSAISRVADEIAMADRHHATVEMQMAYPNLF